MITLTNYHHAILICDQCGNIWKRINAGPFNCPECKSRKTHFAKNKKQTIFLLKNLNNGVNHL